MEKPRIGLTTYRQRGQSGIWDTEMAFIPSMYIDAITSAGGIATLIPPQQLSENDARTLLSGLDGLVVTGGRDVDPARYGQEPEALTDEPDSLRDATEATLLSVAIEDNFPFLGICRGAQLLNVVLGGTLIQHLPDRIGTSRYQIEKGVFNPVPVSVFRETKLGQIVGESIPKAMMYHHQAIDRVGRGLVVSAKSEDGVIEAIELPDQKFGIAVQWHPEQDLSDLRIFEAFIGEVSLLNK